MNERERRRLLAPILLGVVGHTQLRPEDHAAISASVRAILADLRARHPSTPVTLVSSLAEGADQLCAEVALEAGIDVIAPLPFPVELYGPRFKSPPARDNLGRLVRLPAVKAFCPVEGGAAAPDFAAIVADDQRRKQRYADTAIFVARHSHALIALWDGVEDANPSLTAQLIAFKTVGRSIAGTGSSGSAPEPGVVFSIYAPRVGASTASGRTPGTREVLPRSGSEPVAYEELFRQTCDLTEALNARLAERDRPASNDLSPPLADCTETMDDLAAFRHLAAVESYRCKRHVAMAYLLVFGLVFLGATLLHIYGHHTSVVDGAARYQSALFVGSFTCLVFAGLFPRLFQTRRIENRALDYRALAEALRVQFYWHLAGLREWVPDHYLRRQRSELTWIREATRAWALRLQAEAPAPAATTPKLGALATTWFDRQREFHAEGHRKNEWADRCANWVSISFLRAALFIAALLLVGSALEQWISPPQFVRHAFVDVARLSITEPSHLYLVAIGITLLVGALSHAYSGKLLFAEHARRFGAMRDVYRDAAAQAAAHLATGRREPALRVLQQIGEESLDENTEWLILHRIRHFEVPTSG